MKKKLAKWIGSLILISMILTSVCPLSVLAADEPAPPAETPVITETESPQETPQETPAQTTEPQVTEVPAAGDTAGSQTITGETDLEKETNTVLNASEEGIVAGGEKAANPDEKKDDSENASDNPDEKKEDADGTDSQDADKKEGELNEKKEEKSEIQEKADEPVKVEATRGESDAGEKVEEEKKDSIPSEEPFDNTTDVADGTYTEDDENVTFVHPKTNRVTMTIKKVVVSGGRATAVVETSSGSQTHVYVGAKTKDEMPTGEADLVDASGNLITNVYGITDKTFTIPVKLNKEGVGFLARTTGMSAPSWTGYTYTITITEPEEPSEEPFDNTTDVADGTYTEDDENVTFVHPKTNRVTMTIKKVVVSGGRATAVVETSSGSQTHVYVGAKTKDEMPTGEADLVDASGNLITNVYGITDKTFTIPVKLNKEGVGFLARTTGMSAPSWTGYTYTITITEAPQPQEADYAAVEAAKAKVPDDLSVYTEESVAKLQTALDAVVEGKKADEQATVDGWAKAIEDAVAGLEKKDGTPVSFDELTEGTYTATVTCEQSMFPIGKACTVTVKKDNDNAFVFDVVIKMKSAANTAQSKVFLGLAKDAPANEGSWINHGTDENGIYTFKLTNVPIGKPFDLAAYSVNTNKWYDRQLIIDKDSFIKGEGQAPADDGSSDSKNDQQEITVLDGGTAAVDNSTTLPDGVYTPDSFAFSGGSGRATISCRSVTVTNGRAYATIAFSSTNYGYVKAAGGVYYPSIEGGESVFTIPIQLNANNTIIGMTTAMSQAHEVTYTIYVYIEAAGAGALSGGEEIKLEHAELLKMFRYDNGCVLVEIDRTKDTVLDPEKLAKETEENKDDAAQNKTAPTEETTEAAEEEGGQSNVKTDADYAMELYQADVVKYLIVPEGVEIPAGMEKQVLVIRLPKDSVYVSSEDEAEAMESLGLLELIKATGLTEENCKNEALKNLLRDGKVVSTGEIDDVDYNKLVKAEADLVLGAGGDILPKEAEKDKKAKDYQDQYTKITERMALLNIPMLIDRSADEKDPKGQLEWLKLYGILFGKEKEADALIAKGVQ